MTDKVSVRLGDLTEAVDEEARVQRRTRSQTIRLLIEDGLAAKSGNPDTGCPTLCDADCAMVCHEAHEVSFKQDHDPQACRGNQLTQAERRGAAKELRAMLVDQGNEPISIEWIRERADEIEADL